MNETLVHRGPDDSGVVCFPHEGVALGMRRLSILDIEGGHQPMWDEGRTCCVVFNGEIYNFQTLREQLARRGHVFATHHSDTEVLVHGWREWGQGMFEKLNGMFACAIWDRPRQRLILARDRVGEKPLYVATIPGGYAVASELKALLTHPEVKRKIDPIALEQYLSYDYTLAPRTILHDVVKLPAAHFADVTADRMTVSSYWTPQFTTHRRPIDEALKGLDDLLDCSVAARMVADVPVGLFLSGGVDSSTIGYYMRRHSERVQSFSIGFDDPRFDESKYAALAARAIGTDHHLEIFSEPRVREVLQHTADILDEPMGDSSIFPTYLLSAFTRGSVKVALGGDGSDELFMGYKAYQPLKVGWTLENLPYAVRRGLATVARAMPSQIGARELRGVRFLRLTDQTSLQRFLNHLGSFDGSARWLLQPDVRHVLPRSVFDEPREHILADLPISATRADQTVAAYVRTYLQEDILVKIDRASMASSLEVRSPFLDPAVIDFAFALPPSLKMRGLTRKYILRRLMRGRLPSIILDRPKKGFAVPLDSWMRSALAPLLREYLDPERLNRNGLFDGTAVAGLVNAHLSGARNFGSQLWLLLNFELWRERWLL